MRLLRLRLRRRRRAYDDEPSTTSRRRRAYADYYNDYDDAYYNDDHYDDHPDKTDEDAMRQLEDRLSNLVTSQQFDDKQFDDKLSDLATTIANLEKNTVDAAAADREERARLLRVLQDLSTTIGIHGQQ